uniref:Uncharacterized protein n=1 Tax=Setaria digitata TaxID=48799 RepID=A0A915PUQ1_9BILA
MVDSQRRLLALRQQLDDSIRLYYSRQQQTSTNHNSNGGRSVIAVSPKSRRVLHLLYQDEINACIQISDKGRNSIPLFKEDGWRHVSDITAVYEGFANVSVFVTRGSITKKTSTVVIAKTPNSVFTVSEKNDSLMKSATLPLQVIVNSGSQQQHSTSGATINFMAEKFILIAVFVVVVVRPILVNYLLADEVSRGYQNKNIPDQFKFNSPVGSVDSGVSSLSSSNSSPASSPGCSPISVKNVPFQYGKKKIESSLILGEVVEQQIISRGRSTSESLSSTNGLKGILKKSIPAQFTSGRFLRSYSECQSREEEEGKVVVSDLSDGNSAGCTPRKKHVSFSERLVQERSFRPNSSILSQKKKNQRRQKNKMKKKGALSGEDILTNDGGRQRSNCEMAKCNDTKENEAADVCSCKVDDETDPIEYDLAACVLEDPVVLEKGTQPDSMNCHGTAKVHKHMLLISPN